MPRADGRDRAGAHGQGQVSAFPSMPAAPMRPGRCRSPSACSERLGPKSVPLGYQRIAPSRDRRRSPLARWLRDPEKLLGLAMFDEYRFEWPERICMDTVLDAERLGAVARNYTAVTDDRAAPATAGRLTLADQLQPGATATVRRQDRAQHGGHLDRPGERVGGIDGAQAHHRHQGRAHHGAPAAGMRRITASPPSTGSTSPSTASPGAACISSGPPRRVYEGDPDNIRASDDEIDWLIDETNHMLPALNLRREHVLFTWAGVRPLRRRSRISPRASAHARCTTSRPNGLPGVYAMTAGPIMTHRSAGVEDGGARRRPN